MKLMVWTGNSIINRFVYGSSPLTTRDGLYTHAVYGAFSRRCSVCSTRRIPRGCA